MRPALWIAVNFSLLTYLASAARLEIATDAANKETQTLLKDAVASGDALELCGSAGDTTLAWLSSDCAASQEEGTASTDGPGLEAIATDRGQPGDYKMPAFRLYVCNPTSPVRGFLFNHHGFEKIETQERMLEVAAELLTNKLFRSRKGDVFEFAYAYYKKQKGTRSDMNQALLWVLDKGGNFAIAPEVQNRGLVKHGDLTPGSTPLDRADGGGASVGACCCKSNVPRDDCKYNAVFDSDNCLKCCRWIPGTSCPLVSTYTKVSGLCNQHLAQTEQHSHGRFRGVARAGGEIRFPDDGSPAWVQDKSGYSLQRVQPSQLQKDDGSFDPDLLSDVKERSPELGTCAMARLRDYLATPLSSGAQAAQVALAAHDNAAHSAGTARAFQAQQRSGLGWPVESMRFAAVSFPDGKEVMTDA